MLAVECEILTHEEGHNETTIQLQLQKQHAIPTLTTSDQARIKIKACCLDETDIKMRNFDYPDFLSSAYTPSYICGGIIDELGPDCISRRKGEEVIAIIPMDDKNGAAAEYTVQHAWNIFPKPASLSHEDACAVVWSGIQAFTCLNYQMRVRPGDRILVCTSTVCNDLVLSCLAGLLGAKLIVVTHSSATTSLFTAVGSAHPTTSNSSNSTHSPHAHGSPSDRPPMNPLAHVLRVVDCSSLSTSAANLAVLAAVMEETGGLGVDGIIDLQYVHYEWNHMATQRKQQATRNMTEPVTPNTPNTHATTGDDSVMTSEAPQTPTAAVAAASSPLPASLADLTPIAPAPLSKYLTPAHPISFSTLVQCLGCQGRLLTSTPNLQLDPPTSRQLYLRGGTLAFIFTQQWILGSTQRGKLAHIVTEVLSLASSGILPPSVHSRYPLSSISAAWKTLTTNCSVGKVILTAVSSLQLQTSGSRREDRQKMTARANNPQPKTDDLDRRE